MVKKRSTENKKPLIIRGLFVVLRSRALYFGQPLKKDSLLWLAVYNLSSINFDCCKVLKGRDVFLFPKLSKNGYAYNLWKQRAEQIQSKLPNTRFMVSDYLEKRATDQKREKGHDLADYLIQKDWYQFR